MVYLFVFILCVYKIGGQLKLIFKKKSMFLSGIIYLARFF